MFHLSVNEGYRYVMISKINATTFNFINPYLDRFAIENGQIPITSSILAYRPKYMDRYQTGLGAIFINLNKLFPCTANTLINPVCRRFTQDEDGFFNGKAITEGADGGHDINIFPNNAKTYGFVFESCPYLNGTNGCYPNYFQTVITCFIPRSCL